jgi:hypothetical protein
MKAFDLTHKPSFRQNYLDPALEGGWIERTNQTLPAVQPGAIDSQKRNAVGCNDMKSERRP